MIAYKIIEACQEAGCPVCRLEQQAVERYLDQHFYENVNSPAWRERLRSSLGFCQEHAWLGVDKRLGDALGYAIVYHDLINTILDRLHEENDAEPGRGRWRLWLQRVPERARTLAGRLLQALTPRKPCPVCEHGKATGQSVLSALEEDLQTQEMLEALEASAGLCARHLRLMLEHIPDGSAGEQLVSIHRKKLESLRAELALFIRKNDYQMISEGFGKEGDAWLRAVAAIAGSRKRG